MGVEGALEGVDSPAVIPAVIQRVVLVETQCVVTFVVQVEIVCGKVAGVCVLGRRH